MIIWIDNLQLGSISKSSFFKLSTDKAHRQFRTVNLRKTKCWQNIAKSSDMIEMTIRQKNSVNFFFQWKEKRDVRKTKLRSHLRVIGNLKTDVYEYIFFTILENTHIFTHLVMSPDDDNSRMIRHEKRKFWWSN